MLVIQSCLTVFIIALRLYPNRTIISSPQKLAGGVVAVKEIPVTFRVSQYRQGEWHYLQRFFEPTHIRVNHLRAIDAFQLVLSNECQMSDM